MDRGYQICLLTNLNRTRFTEQYFLHVKRCVALHPLGEEGHKPTFFPNPRCGVYKSKWKGAIEGEWEHPSSTASHQ